MSATSRFTVPSCGAWSAAVSSRSWRRCAVTRSSVSARRRRSPTERPARTRWTTTGTRLAPPDQRGDSQCQVLRRHRTVRRPLPLGHRRGLGGRDRRSPACSFRRWPASPGRTTPAPCRPAAPACKPPGWPSRSRADQTPVPVVIARSGGTLTTTDMAAVAPAGGQPGEGQCRAAGQGPRRQPRRSGSATAGPGRHRPRYRRPRPAPRRRPPPAIEASALPGDLHAHLAGPVAAQADASQAAQRTVDPRAGPVHPVHPRPAARRLPLTAGTAADPRPRRARHPARRAGHRRGQQGRPAGDVAHPDHAAHPDARRRHRLRPVPRLPGQGRTPRRPGSPRRGHPTPCPGSGSRSPSPPPPSSPRCSRCCSPSSGCTPAWVPRWPSRSGSCCWPASP